MAPTASRGLLWPPDELQLHPVVVVWIYISKQRWNPVHVVDDDIDLAVVEEVSKCGSTANADNGKPCSLNGRHQLELPILQVMKQ